jgi:condensin complex subunit 1
MTANAVSALHDKTPSVRKASTALLTKSIVSSKPQCHTYYDANRPNIQVTHPFGIMHGGELRFAEWEARYEEVTKELEKLENRPVDEAGMPVNGK